MSDFPPTSQRSNLYEVNLDQLTRMAEVSMHPPVEVFLAWSDDDQKAFAKVWRVCRMAEAAIQAEMIAGQVLAGFGLKTDPVAEDFAFESMSEEDQAKIMLFRAAQRDLWDRINNAVD